MPMTTLKHSLEQREAYRLGINAHHENGCYVQSPFAPWSMDDMAWESAMDDNRPQEVEKPAPKNRQNTAKR